jgi:integrase
MDKQSNNGEPHMELIVAARELANDILRVKRAPSTIKGYLQAYRRLNAVNQTPAEYCQTLATSKGVYYATKAAYQYGLAIDIKAVVDAWFGFKQSPQIQPQVFARAKDLYAKLKGCAPDYARSHQHRDVRRGWEPVRKKKSKRQVLGGLPKNWRELVIDAAKPQHKNAITVLSASGCRPAELAKGIDVASVDGTIVIVIQGVKVTEYSGQPQRIILLDPLLNPFARMLFDQLQPDEAIIVKVNRWTLFDAVKSAVKRAGISKRKRVTPYCFRHQFASDVKAEGLSASEALGHATNRTQSNYGQKGQAKGRSGVKATKVTRPVRQIEGRGTEQHDHLGPRRG